MRYFLHVRPHVELHKFHAYGILLPRLRIRIHLNLIRIRIRHFRLNTDPGPDPIRIQDLMTKN
jgi:hypothetical protein